MVIIRKLHTYVLHPVTTVIMFPSQFYCEYIYNRFMVNHRISAAVMPHSKPFSWSTDLTAQLTQYPFSLKVSKLSQDFKFNCFSN